MSVFEDRHLVRFLDDCGQVHNVAIDDKPDAFERAAKLTETLLKLGFRAQAYEPLEYAVVPHRVRS